MKWAHLYQLSADLSAGSHEVHPMVTGQSSSCCAAAAWKEPSHGLQLCSCQLQVLSENEGQKAFACVPFKAHMALTDTIGSFETQNLCNGNDISGRGPIPLGHNLTSLHKWKNAHPTSYASLCRSTRILCSWLECRCKSSVAGTDHGSWPHVWSHPTSVRPTRKNVRKRSC